MTESVEEQLFTTITNKELEELTQIEGNNKCFDCDKSPSNWVCVNNGIFLCATCAGEHRNYGIVVSKIKSLILDSFTPYQIALLKAGGNKNLKNLLNEYDIKINKGVNRYPIYVSKIMEYNRETLYCKLTGKNLPPKVEKKEALEKMENIRVPTRTNLDNIQPVEQKNEPPKQEEQQQNEQPKQEEKKEEQKFSFKGFFSMLKK